MFRCAPDDEFPDPLSGLPLAELQMLDSRIWRQLDHENGQDGVAHPETLFRHDLLNDELRRRYDAAAGEG